MEYRHDTTDFYSEVPTAVTLGKFDGLHRGHQKLIREVVRLQKEGFYGIVFTIAPEKNPVLLTAEEKLDALEQYGIDCMIRCPYVPEILSLEPERFVDEFLCGRLQAKHIVVGTDFRFGCRRGGDVKLLESMQERYGFHLTVVEKECHLGREISSTYVRESLEYGDMGLVRDLLGFCYPVTGTVVHGRKLGRTFGMPTINIIPEQGKLLPSVGVYYSDVTVGEIRCHGITNIGYKPTVDGSFLGVETYLYGVHADLYGCHARIEIRNFLRPERRFATVEDLKAQMERDILSGKEYFGVS